MLLSIRLARQTQGHPPCRAAHEIKHPHGEYVRRAEPCVHAQSPARHQPGDESTGDIAMRFALLLIISISLTGCADSIVGDALAGPEKLARQDDAYCQSIDTKFGTPEYAACRESATARRDAHHARGADLVAAGASIAATPPPQLTMVCQTNGNQTICNNR